MDASQVSKSKRLAQVISSVVFCFFLAGIVFGFAALKPILLDSGIYADQCPEGDRCKAQDSKLNTLFVVASSLNNIGALPMGTFLDRVGPRAATLTGGALCGAGSVIFSLGIVKPYFDSYLVGFALLGLSSPALFLAQFHLSNAFPSRSGLILGSITGAFDASSLSVVLYKVVYFRLGSKPSLWVDPQTRDLALMRIIQKDVLPGLCSSTCPSDHPAAIFWSRFTLRSPILHGPRNRTSPPSSSITPPADLTERLQTPQRLRSRRMSSSFSRVSYNVHDHADDEEVKDHLGKGGRGDGIVGVLFGKNIREQVASRWWLAMEFMVIVHMTRINWYLTTVNSQLVYYTGDLHLADKLTNAFIFLLPLAGLVSIPAIGILLDTRPLLDTVLVMGTMGALFGVLTLLHGAVPQLIGLGMLVVFRPLFYTAMSDYGAKVFGFQTFGTVYGLGMTISGICGFVLTPLDLFTKGPMNGSYTPVNLALLILGLISSFMMAYTIWSHTPRGRIRLSENQEVGESNTIHEEEEADS